MNISNFDNIRIIHALIRDESWKSLHLIFWKGRGDLLYVYYGYVYVMVWHNWCSSLGGRRRWISTLTMVLFKTTIFHFSFSLPVVSRMTLLKRRQRKNHDDHHRSYSAFCLLHTFFPVVLFPWKCSRAGSSRLQVYCCGALKKVTSSKCCQLFSNLVV